MTHPKDQPVDEQYQTITDICAANGGVTKPMADKLYAYFQAECNRARIDPFDFVEPCEEGCTPERHAYHEGQWDMATRMEAELQQLMKEGE